MSKRKLFALIMDYPCKDLDNCCEKRNRPLVGKVTLNIRFSFATLEALRNTPWDIARLKRGEIGLYEFPGPSFKNLPESSSTSETLAFYIFSIIFANFS